MALVQVLSLSLLLLALPAVFASPPVSVIIFGAQPNVDTNEVALKNSAALRNALEHVQTLSPPRTVIIPSGAEFFSYNSTMVNISDTLLRIEGTWTARDDIQNWPNDTRGDKPNFIDFYNTSNLVVNGGGLIRGQGKKWWWDNILLIEGPRPHLFHIEIGLNTVISDLELRNSPQYHLLLEDMLNLLIYNITIYVDVDGQQEMLRSAGRYHDLRGADGELLGRGIPTFPLNTDGIDIRAKNATVRNCTIKNEDDSVCIKPMSGSGTLAQCAEDILVEDIAVTFGVGMTIGSVPPNENNNCVKNVIFRRVNFTTPIKSVYVKSNPGDTGYGIIQNITYEDINIVDPIWWNIYIGPQQQDQPHHGSGPGGPGCMLYPIKPDCPTQPRITMKDITLRNIHSTGGLLSPGVLRCNATNPGTGFIFDNVHVGGSDWPTHGYVCENIQGKVFNSTPTPNCFTEVQKREDLYA